ncbi:hypothetical protein Glove_309g150 [Diversispora epigaea]|uniref:Cyclin N-terminal domain-containing protein n=1 Tax=Diversispora epigaea TaxID=1348612 RepID=A0A397HVS5_9GLOM|nr:hypothetical protein Glove_309g150 [Diversispora epigaea]
MCVLGKELFKRVPNFAAYMTNFLLFGDYSSGGGVRGDFKSYEPSFEFKEFCCQVISAGPFSSSVIILALLYIAKLKKKRREDKVDNGTEHQVFACALMLADKYLNDISYGSKFWTGVLNISVSQLNIMEREFLVNLDFRLHVSEQKYHEWAHNLYEYITGDNDNSACSYVAPPPPSRYTEEDHQRVMAAFNALLRRQKLKRSAEKAFENEMEISSSKRRKRDNDNSACSYVAPPPPSRYTEEDHQRVMAAFNALLRRQKLKRSAEKAFENEMEISSSKRRKRNVYRRHHH